MSYDFNSTTDRLIAGTTTPPATGSLSLWICPNWAKTDGVYHTLFQAFVDGNNFFNIVHDEGSNAFYAGWYTAGAEHRAVAAVGDYTWNASAWNHMAVTWDDSANATRLYIGGTLVASQTSTLTTFSTTTTGNTIGNEAIASTNFNLDGRLAEVAIWSRILDADELAALAAAASPSFFNRSGTYYWPLVRDLHDLWGGDTARNVNAAVAEHCRVFLPCGGRLNSKPPPAASPWSGRLAASDSYLVRLPE